MKQPNIVLKQKNKKLLGIIPHGTRQNSKIDILWNTQNLPCPCTWQENDVWKYLKALSISWDGDGRNGEKMVANPFASTCKSIMWSTVSVNGLVSKNMHCATDDLLLTQHYMYKQSVICILWYIVREDWFNLIVLSPRNIYIITWNDRYIIWLWPFSHQITLLWYMLCV